MAPGLPSAVLVEIEFTLGVWTDVASLVKGDSLEIHVGRDSSASGIQPGTLDVDLDNADGRFTPDNPTSTHFPNFVEGKRIRVRVTYSATTYVRFVGRITSLSPSFPTGEPTQSVTHVAAVDTLGDLARITLPSIVEAVARRNAAGSCAFYPLTDANEHVGMFDILAVAPRLRIWDANPGTGRIDAAADASLGDDRSYVQLFDGKGLYTTSTFPAGLVNPTLTVMVKVSSSSYGEVLAGCSGRREGSRDYSRVRWASTGFIVDTIVDGLVTGSSTPIVAADGWYWIRLDPAIGTLDVVGDGYTGIETSPGAAPTGITHVSLGGDCDVTASQLLILGGAGSQDYDSEDTLTGYSNLDLALARYATAVYDGGLSATFAWSTTPTYFGSPMVTDGENALDVLSWIADSQSGHAYAVPSTDPSQTVELVANSDSRPTTVALTIDAEGDLAAGPTLERDITERIRTAVASSWASAVTVTDSTITDVGAATADITTILGLDNDLYAVASDRVARGRDQGTRITQLTVDLATASNDLYAAFFAVTPGERLRLTGLPTAYFGVSYIDGYVEGWSERPSVTGYEIVFDLSPADTFTEAVADTSRAPFGDGVCTVTSGTAVGTTATGTMVLTFTGTALLSTAAGDYPQDFDWNGERVTVTAAPAGGSSPRTLTITARGVAPTVARSHSAGETIDLWQGAQVAL